MVTTVLSAGLVGLTAKLVLIEADIANGLPGTTIVGLPSTAVQESRERVKTAIKNSPFTYPLAKVTVNLAPAHIPKVGTRFDLPIALAVLLVSKQIPTLPKTKILCLGELSLDGTVRGVNGVVPSIMAAKQFGCTEIFLPKANALEASLISGVKIFPVASLNSLAKHFSGHGAISVYIPRDGSQKLAGSFGGPDIAEVHGQEVAKRGLEIAAAGGHNIALAGPPGVGKTMLVKCLPALLPSLSEEEVLEVASIHSVLGSLSVLPHTPPFRAPHHTSSYAAILGGGSGEKPGEITLAHRGILFLDELPEFSRQVLEGLRQPMEERQIVISRHNRTEVLPANFMLVAAYNPCPCGYLGHVTQSCTCTTYAIQKYKQKLSGPLLDRIDLQVSMDVVPWSEMQPAQKQESVPSEGSAVVAKRIELCRNVQSFRFGRKKTNASMSSTELRRYCSVNSEAQNMLITAQNSFRLSTRAITRCLKVARTIADLAGEKYILPIHIAESLQYRVGINSVI